MLLMSWKQITAQARASGQRCPLPGAKVIDAKRKSRRLGKSWKEKKAEVTDGKPFIATTSDAQVQNAENDVNVAQA